MIPYGHQSIDRSDIDEVVQALESDWLTQGPAVDRFEHALADYCGVEHAVALNSGTSGLHAAYAAAGIGSGDEIIMPANTFAATANAALYLGAKPVFCDIRLDTYNIDETKIEALISEKTKAIVPVHFAGHPCEMEKIAAVGKKHNLLVIEDACHALGASYKNKKIGSLSDAAVFSFHPVKSITTGEGGMVSTNNHDLFQKMLMFRTHGITKKSELLKQNDGPWYHEMQILGYNYRITDIQCALGVSQLKKLNSFVTRRREIAAMYHEQLQDIKDLILPTELADAQSASHLFVIRVPAVGRKKIFMDFQAAGIGAQVHYIPVYHHPYYRENGFANCSLPNTEEYYASCISLPIYPDLTDDQIKFIVAKAREIIQ